MRFTFTFLILVTALVDALPARAQHKAVAPTFRSARADVAASLPRHGGVKPPLWRADLKVSATQAASTPAKPFTQKQVVSMVRDGFGDESGAKLIEQRGIDFTPSEDFYQTLKAAGASEAFLNALRAAQQPESASAKKLLNQVQVFALLVGQVPSHRVSMLVQERGIDFEPTDDYLQEVRLAGGEDELISALKSAKVTKPATIEPTAEARQAEVRQHMARGAELGEKKEYAQAEQEFRAASLLDSQNADVYVSLAYILSMQEKWDDAAAAAREAIHLDPNNDDAHVNLGTALATEGDWDDAIIEEREALRLNASNDKAHVNLGAALGQKGDRDGEIIEEREAMRLNPSNDKAHVNLGTALGSEGDWDGEIAEYREALRLNPGNGAAHVGLGLALGQKGDQDGAIAEEREGLRLNPSNGLAHAALGLELEQKGDRQGAIEEYRAAYMHDPQDATYKQNYERLLRQVNHRD
jgi:tetratricopeptide (TPR) repeat protein